MEKPTQLLGQPKETAAREQRWRGQRWAPASAAATDKRGPRVSEGNRGEEQGGGEAHRQ